MPEISVIVPVYKAEKYLKSCIDSILSQTFTDFEILLVDDGSPDNCGRICDEYAAGYDCISVIHQENKGQAAARNHAMNYAKGSWFCFVDSDDLIHPRMLELLHRAAVSADAPVSMCRMLEAPTLPEEFFKDPPEQFQTLSMDEKTLLKLYDADDYPAWVACAKLIRRKLVEAYPFREGKVFEDNEAVCHWICEGKKLAQMDCQLYFYRTNDGSTTKSTFSMKKLDYLWALESIIRYYESLGFDLMRRRFFERYVDTVISSCNGLRYILGQEDSVKAVERQFWKLAKEQRLKPTHIQLEALLDATHPRLIKLYWPLAGAVKTVRDQGISGIIQKMTKHVRKGEQK